MPKTLTFEDYDLSPTPEDLKRIYDSGFKGCLESSTFVQYRRLAGATTFYDAFPEARDIGKGKIILPFRTAQIIEPEFGRMERQQTGDCVSHGQRNAGTIDWSADIFFGETKVPQDAAKPRLCTENIYGARGHGGQGANVGMLVDYCSTSGPGGFLIRKRYTAPNGSTIDLSDYNPNVGINWGPRGTPSWVNEIAAQNKSLRVFPCRSLFEARDASALGFGLHRGSWMGFSSRRNEDGVAEMEGRWAHAESWIGFDDSDYMRKKYGTHEIGVPLEQNSWGVWNGGPKRHEQPDGSYFMRAKIAQRMIDDGEVYIICSVRGYERELVYDRHTELSRLYAA